MTPLPSEGLNFPVTVIENYMEAAKRQRLLRSNAKTSSKPASSDPKNGDKKKDLIHQMMVKQLYVLS